MNVIQIKDAALYAEANGNSGHYQLKRGDQELHFAFMVLERFEVPGTGTHKAVVIEGTADSELAAIEHLNRQCKLLRDWMDIAFHSGFWPAMAAEQARREKQVQALIREAQGLPALPDKPTDDGGLS